MNKKRDNGFMLVVRCSYQRRSSRGQSLVDISIEVVYQESYKIHVFVLGCDDQRRGSTSCCLVDVNVELICEEPCDIQVSVLDCYKGVVPEAMAWLTPGSITHKIPTNNRDLLNFHAISGGS
jgi:hypothetical protein